MMVRGQPVRVEPIAIATVSTWEAVAIITGVVPTVTMTVMRFPRPARVIIIGLTAWWLTVHFKVVAREAM